MKLEELLKKKNISLHSLFSEIRNNITNLASGIENNIVFITLSIWSFIDNKPYISYEVFCTTSKDDIDTFYKKLQNLINEQKFSITEYFLNNNIKDCYYLNNDSNELQRVGNSEKLIITENEEKLKAIIKLHREELFKKTNVKYVYFFPIGSYLADNKTTSLIVVNAANSIDEKILKTITSVVYGVMVNLILIELEHLWKLHALRSAVAAIMARNLSHNIGSHVQHYLSKEDYFENPDDFWITKGI